MLIRVSDWVASAPGEFLGAKATDTDRAAYCAYLQASLPPEVESSELKFWAEEAWERAIRDWSRLVGPFYRH
ncbi:MAG: hypothetical protein MUF79_09020 [Burkholderiales bacterium]|jgi:hypothetical protein|nr:hypothetical protein [Burkholderiales bacterium]